MLTEREKEVMILTCQELTAKAIAARIGTTMRMVGFIRGQIMRKIGAVSSIGIAVYAVKNEIYKP